MGGELQLRLTNRALLLVLAVFGGLWLLGHATRILVCSSWRSSSPRRRPPWRTASPATVSRAVAILLTYLALLAILAWLVGLIVPLLTDESALLRDNVPRDQEQANALLARLPGRVGAAPRVNDLVAPLGTRAQTAAGDVGCGGPTRR